MDAKDKFNNTSLQVEVNTHSPWGNSQSVSQGWQFGLRLRRGDELGTTYPLTTMESVTRLVDCIFNRLTAYPWDRVRAVVDGLGDEYGSVKKKVE